MRTTGRSPILFSSLLTTMNEEKDMESMKGKTGAPVLVGPCWLGFHDLVEPKSFTAGEPAKYRADLLFGEKSDAIKNSVLELVKICGPEHDKKLLKSPWKDGNSVTKKETGETYSAYVDMVYISTSSKFPPRALQNKLGIDIEASDFGLGDKVMAYVQPHYWERSADVMTDKGMSRVIVPSVNFYLVGLQLLEKEERGKAGLPSVSFTPVNDDFAAMMTGDISFSPVSTSGAVGLSDDEIPF